MSPEFVRFVCTGAGHHSRLKLAEWTIQQGHAVPYYAGGHRPSPTDLRRRIQAMRDPSRLPALDLMCRKCPTDVRAGAVPSNGSAQFPTFYNGVRNVRATHERATTIISKLLGAPEFATRNHVVIDISQEGAILF